MEARFVGNYDVFNTTGFDIATSGGVPNWLAVEIDPVLNGAVFAGEFFNLSTFTNEVGFWREDGSFLFSTGSDTSFADFEIYNGQLVASINGVDDGLFVGSSGFVGLDSGGNFFVATASAIPEPTSLGIMLLLSGLLAGTRRRSRRDVS